MFNTFTPFEQRLPELGDILGKKQEAEEWLNDYNKKAGLSSISVTLLPLNLKLSLSWFLMFLGTFCSI